MDMIRVLVVDDSALVRDMIRAMIDVDPETTVAGEASNGLEAVAMVRDLRPDIVTMDIDMPVMDGLEAIERIMAENAVPILVVTSRGDAKTAFAAISKGALDLVVKPDVSLEGAHEFVAKLKLMSKVGVVTHIAGRLSREKGKPLERPAPAGETVDRVVAVASSTGGPDALSVILSHLPAGFSAPIVIAQHMSDGFVRGMADWLMTVSRREVTVAAEGDALKTGVVYVCPSERHMNVEPSGKITLAERRPQDIYRPSCDALLMSVAKSYGPKAIGVILTGMGSDGVTGIKEIKDGGGRTIAQDEGTSVIFGMPKLAIEEGCVDTVLPVEKIAEAIVKAATDGGRPKARAES